MHGENTSLGVSSVSNTVPSPLGFKPHMLQYYADVGIFHHFDQRLLPRIGLMKRNDAKKFFISI